MHRAWGCSESGKRGSFQNGGVASDGGGWIFVNGHFHPVPPRSPREALVESLAVLASLDFVQDKELRTHLIRTTLANMNTNISALVESLGRTLDNLANMTAGLNQQVQSNTNILAGISATITHYDEFIQGLKHHWLLRSAFKTKNTNGPPRQPVQPLRSPKERSR